MANIIDKGNLLQAQGDFNGAFTTYMQALEADPSNHIAHHCIGNNFKFMADIASAHLAYAKAIELNKNYSPALCELAIILFYDGDLRGSLFYLNRLIEISPAPDLTIAKAIIELPLVFDDKESIAHDLTSLDCALMVWMNNKEPNRFPIPTPFNLAYRYGDHTERLRCFGAGFVSSNAIAPPPPRERKRLLIVTSVGYPSVWNIILHGIMENIDHSLFEVVLLPLGPSVKQWTGIEQALQAMAEVCLNRTASIEPAIVIINNMKPDIIFYPEIGMDDTTFYLASMRLAPLQVASWGHPITTGLKTIDLFLSGELIEPDNAESHYIERLVKLPGTGALTPTPKPVQPTIHNLDRRVIKFALCQAAFKFDPSDDELIIRIAKAVGKCEFWLLVMDNKDGEKLKMRINKAFWDNGLDPYLYLRAFPFQDEAGFAGLLDELDIYLDCPAFSGYTTARKAIHRGIPIVTLEGEFMRQRLAAGLLRQIGITDTIAKTRDDYVDIALRLAKETPTERNLRRLTIKEAAPMADNNIAVVRAFEQALLSD